MWRKLDPRGPARRLGAAWRVGRLRAALPGLATDVLATVDAHLAEVPALEGLTLPELVRLLERAGDELVSLHGYEVLAGQLLNTATESPTGASAALRVLAEARAAEPEADDDELIARYPVLLALLPPAIDPGRRLPPTTALLPRPTAGSRLRDDGRADPGVVREALRLRIRWIHELTARAALAVGRALVARGALGDPTDVRHLPMSALRDAVAGGAPAVVRPSTAAAPLPAAFRLAGAGVVVPVAVPMSASGHGAGGGRVSAPVHNRPALADADPAGSDVPDGAVLVVPTLDPSLAPLLPRLGGLVAETGSVLSHLAHPRPRVRRAHGCRSGRRHRPVRRRHVGGGGRHERRVRGRRRRRMEGGVSVSRLGLLALAATLGASGWYLFAYLYRWEWNRAVIAGVIFVAAEVALIGTLVIERLGRLERRIDQSERRPASHPDPAVLDRLRETAPAPSEPFAWLTRRPDETSVFVPVLLGAGVVFSALAWVVERVARVTARPAAEESLARRLDSLALPSGGLIGEGEEGRPDLFSPLS